MEFTGKIISEGIERGGVGKTSNNPWLAKEYVIEEEEGTFHKKMCFEVFGEDKIRTFNLHVGDSVTVSFDIDARQWNDRWFNTIRVWKVEHNAPAADSQSVNLPENDEFPFK